MKSPQSSPLPAPHPVIHSQQRQAHRIRLALAFERCYPTFLPDEGYVSQARQELPLLLARLHDADAIALWEAVTLLYHVPLDPVTWHVADLMAI